MDSDLTHIFMIISLVGLFILISYLVFTYMKFPPKMIEGLQNNDYVILMGDSIFKNDGYVNLGDSVGSKLQEEHGNVLVVAEDGATVPDLDRQFRAIPERANEKNTKIIVSIGGNDLLEKYMFNDVENLNHVDSIFNKYTSEINNMRNNCDCEFVLCNIYYPRSRSYVKYYDIIEKWNKKLDVYAKNNNIRLIKLDDSVNNKHYFTNDIEPSSAGGDVIIDNILNLK